MNAKWRITLALVAGLLVIVGTLLATESAQDNTARQNMTVALTLGNVIYVDQDAPGPAHNGLSWTTAYTNVQQALTTAISGTEIWVAEGVYYPGAYVNSTFVLTDGVALYGGFAATETLRTQRNWAAHVTVLSGDTDRNDINADGNYIAETWTDIQGNNVYSVVTGDGTDNAAMLDGFTITAGSSCPAPHDKGGGMYNSNASPRLANVTFSGNRALYGGGMYNTSSSPTLTNVTFSGNQTWNCSPASGAGGGMYNTSGSNPALTNVTFSNNQAAGGSGGGMHNTSGSGPTLTNVTFSANQAFSGGGMSNASSSPTLMNVIFSGNQAGDGGGGGMRNYNSSPALTNVTFSGNSASNYGGGMFNNSSNPTLTNVTFSGNSAFYHSGGMFNYNSSNPALTNCILWGDSPNEISSYSSVPLITYSDVQGGHAGAGNINADPLFVAPITATAAPTTTGNYRLLAGSQAIDAGNSLSVTVSNDLDGRPRIIGAAVDMGAYEFGYQYQVYLPLVRRN